MNENQKILTDEDIKLLKKIGGYLSHSTDMQTSDLLYRPPGQALREQADYLDAKDQDINDFRKLLDKLNP